MTVPLPEGAMRALSAQVGASLRVGNEGAGTVIEGVDIVVVEVSEFDQVPHICKLDYQGVSFTSVRHCPPLSTGWLDGHVTDGGNHDTGGRCRAVLESV